MTQQQLINWLERHGYTLQRNHYHKGETRVKLQARSVRFERAWRSSYDNKLNYTRVASGYYGKLSVTDEDKLKGLTR